MTDTDESITPPARFNEPGFYYHYKHDPNGPVEEYAYYIFTPGHHTEEDARPQDKFMQVYLPLYESALVYQMGKFFDLRPLGMAVEEVRTDKYAGPRFYLIEDEHIIEQLKEQGRKMYPHLFPW